MNALHSTDSSKCSVFNDLLFRWVLPWVCLVSVLTLLGIEDLVGMCRVRLCWTEIFISDIIFARREPSPKWFKRILWLKYLLFIALCITLDVEAQEKLFGAVIAQKSYGARFTHMANITVVVHRGREKAETFPLLFLITCTHRAAFTGRN